MHWHPCLSVGLGNQGLGQPSVQQEKTLGNSFSEQLIDGAGNGPRWIGWERAADPMRIGWGRVVWECLVSMRDFPCWLVRLPHSWVMISGKVVRDSKLKLMSGLVQAY